MAILAALTGLPRTGKDTVAEHLVTHHGFTRLAFATAIYEELAPNFDATVEQLQSDDWKKNPKDFLAIWHCRDPEYRQRMLALGYDMVEPRTSRFHAQRWGTEYRREDNPMYWVDIVARKLEEVEGSVVISDLRENETEYPFLRRYANAAGMDFTCIQVDRAGITRSDHSSDNGINPHNIDFFVFNREGDPASMLHEVTLHLINDVKGLRHGL